MKTTNKQNLLDAALVGTLAFRSVGTGAARFAKFYFTKVLYADRCGHDKIEVTPLILQEISRTKQKCKTK